MEQDDIRFVMYLDQDLELEYAYVYDHKKLD